jgi:hypothetical protein
MMGDWQQVAALVCVAGAVFVLTFRAARLWKGRAGGGCGSGCHSCPTNASADQGMTLKQGTTIKPLVTLDVIRRDESSRAGSV